MEILKNVDPINLTDDYDVILVGTNIYNKLCNGWQFDMKMKYPDIHKANLLTKYADESKVGKYITINDSNKPIICLLYINKSYFRPDLKKEFVEYEALEDCLHRINIEYRNKRVLCPILGVSKFDGNGDKEKLIKIFETKCPNLKLTLCDYEQISLKERKVNMIREIAKAKEKAKETKDKTEYFNLVSKRKEFDEKLKQINKLIF